MQTIGQIESVKEAEGRDDVGKSVWKWQGKELQILIAVRCVSYQGTIPVESKR